MGKGRSVNAGYETFDALIQQLHADGHGERAARLHTLLHEVPWTTSSELIGELGQELLAFERGTTAVGPELRRHLDACMRLVRQVWPDIGRGSST